jgi:hypothetical protein
MYPFLGVHFAEPPAGLKRVLDSALLILQATWNIFFHEFGQ